MKMPKADEYLSELTFTQRELEQQEKRLKIVRRDRDRLLRHGRDKLKFTPTELSRVTGINRVTVYEAIRRSGRR